MVQTPSKMVDLGIAAPDFSLKDPWGKVYSLDSFKGKKGLLVMFICNHCPFVKHIQKELTKLTKLYMDKGIASVAINSNDYKAYPDDSPEKMKTAAEELGYPFPYLVDETQEVAKAYGAACTPDFFLYDKNQKLYYRGRMDGSTPGNDIPVTGNDLKEAMDSLLKGAKSPEGQHPSIGCNIKWK